MAISEIKVVQTLKECKAVYSVPSDGERLIMKAPQSGKTYSWSAYTCDMADVNQAAHLDFRQM